MPCTGRRRSASPPGRDPLVAGFRGRWMSRVLDTRVRDRGAGGCAPCRYLRTASPSSDVGGRTWRCGLLCASRRREVNASRAGSWLTVRLHRHRCRSFTAGRGTRRRITGAPARDYRHRCAGTPELEAGRHDDWGRTGHRRDRLPIVRVAPERNDPARISKRPGESAAAFPARQCFSVPGPCCSATCRGSS